MPGASRRARRWEEQVGEVKEKKKGGRRAPKSEQALVRVINWMATAVTSPGCPGVLGMLGHPGRGGRAAAGGVGGWGLWCLGFWRGMSHSPYTWELWGCNRRMLEMQRLGTCENVEVAFEPLGVAYRELGGYWGGTLRSEWWIFGACAGLWDMACHQHWI